MFNAEAARAFCLELTGATEDFPFGPGVAVFKIGGKIFAILTTESRPASVSFKCDPFYGAAMREQYPAMTAGYHLNKRHWNTVALDGSIPPEVIQEWVRDSYELVVASLPKRQRASLGSG
jgi:predicted DNA-binding protein (MmcQ/YjbR family)